MSPKNRNDKKLFYFILVAFSSQGKTTDPLYVQFRNCYFSLFPLATRGSRIVVNIPWEKLVVSNISTRMYPPNIYYLILQVAHGSYEVYSGDMWRYPLGEVLIFMTFLCPADPSISIFAAADSAPRGQLHTGSYRYVHDSCLLGDVGPIWTHMDP